MAGINHAFFRTQGEVGGDGMIWIHAVERSRFAGRIHQVFALNLLDAFLVSKVSAGAGRWSQ